MPSGSVLLLAQPTSGGVGRHVRDLAIRLKACGWRVALGCPAEGELPDRVAAAGIAVHPIPYVRSVNPIGDLRGLLATRALIRRVGPDVVHCHSSKAGFLGRAAARSLGLRATAYTPHCLPFSVGSSGAARIYRFAERLAAPWTGRFIAVADAEARQIVDERLAPPERVRRIYNGIARVTGEAEDPSDRAGAADAGGRPSHRGRDVRRAWEATEPESVVFTIVGRADRQKAFDVFVEAALAARPLAREARFVLVGGDYTSEGALTGLAARVRGARAEDAVKILGDRGDIDDLLAASDVLVMPSRWEAFPYVLLEAGNHGLPVIATPVGGVPELISDGETGLLVPVDDVDALAAAMVRLAQDAPLRRRMGQALAERVRPLTVERMVDETIEVYEDLLEPAP